MNRLLKFNLVYLGTPYSKYPFGIEMAFREASRLAGELAKRGVRIHCPISHTHPMAVYGGIDPLDHEFWLKFDAPYMEAADSFLIAKMLSWQSSFGIAGERTKFKSAGKPVLYIDPETLVVGDEA